MAQVSTKVIAERSGGGISAEGSFSRHLRQIVSRSRGNPGRKTQGATHSASITILSVSVVVSPRNGDRPVRIS